MVDVDYWPLSLPRSQSLSWEGHGAWHLPLSHYRGWGVSPPTAPPHPVCAKGRSTLGGGEALATGFGDGEEALPCTGEQHSILLHTVDMKNAVSGYGTESGGSRRRHTH